MKNKNSASQQQKKYIKLLLIKRANERENYWLNNLDVYEASELIELLKGH